MQLKRVVLPGAVGADQPHDHPLLHGEGDVGVGGQAAEELADVLDLQDGPSGSPPFAAASRVRAFLMNAQHAVGHEEDDDDHQDAVDEHVGVGEVAP